MWRNVTVNLSDLLFSVSEVMDLSNVALVDHQIRTAFVASHMASAAGLDHDQAERLFVAALLHDIGALSPEEKVGAHTYEDLRPEPHCERGGKLFREAFWLEQSAPIVEWHHTTMEEHERAGRSVADADVLGAQIVYLADHLERAIQRDTYILLQRDRLRLRVHQLAGSQIHASVVSRSTKSLRPRSSGWNWSQRTWGAVCKNTTCCVPLKWTTMRLIPSPGSSRT